MFCTDPPLEQFYAFFRVVSHTTFHDTDHRLIFFCSVMCAVADKALPFAFAVVR